MMVLGIDTDSRGSVALLDTKNLTLDVYPLPTTTRVTSEGKKRLMLNVSALAAILIDLTSFADVAWLEKQSSRPEQGVVSTFGFGQTYGECRAATAAGFIAKDLFFSNERLRPIEKVEERIHFVTGADWKFAMKLDKDKGKARDLASKLFPECAHAWSLVKHTSAAEASLLAFYGASVLGEKIKPGSVINPNPIPYTRHAESLVLKEKVND